MIVEPVAGNMGCVPPLPGYLARLREITSRAGVLLVFDEVMTGFRVARGGAGERFGVLPDLVCLGKVLGGGLPLAAYGGRPELMESVAPVGAVYQAGTLSGNPLAVAAALATLRLLSRSPPWDQLESLARRLCEGLDAHAAARSIPWTSAVVGGMFGGFFHPGPVVDLTSAKASDLAAFATFHAVMLENGVYLAPSQFEAAFVSIAHDDEALRLTLEAADLAFDAVARRRGGS
jgi:glutamate-1-semialdehyde 2,1-aminomutase